MHAAQRPDDPEGAHQREDHRRVERDGPEPVGLDHDQLLLSTSRLVAQIHERQITDVSNTSLGQCAPSATRAAHPSTSMVAAIAKIGQRPGVFRRSAASTATTPKVTQKKVMVVDGNVSPVGLPATAMSSRDGRGRPKIAFVDSAPYCSRATNPPAITRPRQPATTYDSTNAITIT